MSIGPASTAPGWYRDPSGSPLERWWNGAAWSEATRPAYPPPAQYVAPMPYRSGFQALAPRNGAATAGLALGIICMFINTFLLVSTPAFICSIVGLAKANQLQGAGFAPVGRALAVWGLVLSILGALGTVFLKFLLF